MERLNKELSLKVIRFKLRVGLIHAWEYVFICTYVYFTLAVQSGGGFLSLL